MATPVLVDLRNIFALDMMAEHGFAYHSIGRAAIRPAPPQSLAEAAE